MHNYRENPFVFSGRYRLLRHLVFWVADALVFTFVFRLPSVSFFVQLSMSFVWVPLHIAYAYPVMYFFIPHFLLKQRQGLFILIMVLWGIAGWLWNYICREYVFFHFVEKTFGVVMINRNPWAAASYLGIVVITGLGSTIVLFKYWMKKQKDFLNAEREKTNAELQLLKAQVHPHFLFNTLNNIYSFSMKGSEKTTSMIAKLSTLLSYILYDCRNNEVLLEKEIEVMKDYIDLEKERYGNKLEVSINIEGDIRGRWIAPLLLLPFIENAFKHGTSEQLETPWLSLDLSVKQNILLCKILNSKNELPTPGLRGIGIDNVKKRLSYLYPEHHELKLSDEGDFFVVSLMLDLSTSLATSNKSEIIPVKSLENFSV